MAVRGAGCSTRGVLQVGIRSRLRHSARDTERPGATRAAIVAAHPYGVIRTARARRPRRLFRASPFERILIKWRDPRLGASRIVISPVDARTRA